MPLLYHAYVYLEFLILACTIYILAPYVSEHNAGMKVSNLYISQVKRKCGIEVGKNLRVATRRMDCLQGNSTTAATDLELVPSPNLPKNEDSRQSQCPENKESAIVEALKHFKMIQQE